MFLLCYWIMNEAAFVAKAETFEKQINQGTARLGYFV